MADARALRVLLVEDDPADRLLTEDAFAQARFHSELHCVADGEEALAYLTRTAPFADAPRPDLVLLDLKLPRMNGWHVLRRMKSDPRLRDIPVVVLSFSSAQQDIAAAYDAQASSYLQKTGDLDSFRADIEALQRYWTDVVALPPVRNVDDEAHEPRHRGVVPELRVLVVEDSVPDYLFFADALECGLVGRGPEIVRAARLAEAMELLKEEAFDVVVTDLGLPDATGIEAVQSLRHATGSPLVVITGDTDGRRGREAIASGADDYLVKGDLTPDGIARVVLHAVERHRFRDHLRQADRQKMVGRLAGGVAHDFNNLLTVIRGNLAVLNTGPADAELVAEIVEATERGARLTRQLLALGRQQIGHAGSLALGPFLSERRGLYRRILGPDADVVLKLPPALPPVAFDELGMEQTMLNLVANAADAMPHGGLLTISTSMEPGGGVLLEVTDTGSGIPEAALPHVLEPFYSTKRSAEGSGMGLFSASELTQRHGGRLHLTSTEGVGTTVHLHLRAVDAESVEAPEPVRRGSVAPSQTVVVLDDELHVRRTVGRILHHAGYQVISAGTIEEAVASCRCHDVDLVLSDVLLDEGRLGYEVELQLQAVGCDVPVIWMSGFTGGVARAPVELVEGSNLLAKPFAPDELAAFVGRALAAVEQPSGGEAVEDAS